MKVIFLDIDGVLNVIPQGYDDFGGIFHSNFVDNLRRIIDETGAQIVVSSSWRFSGITKIKDMWYVRNLPGKVIDVTVDTRDLIRQGKFKFHDEIMRGHEIQEWIDKTPELENYLILDDDNDFLPNQLNNFVRTANNQDHPDCIDIGYGLTNICTEMAIEILNKK
jgi:hypothetical protein